METLTYNLGRWTTDELIGEVVRRTVTDGPALRLVETMIIRARLAQSDRRFGGGIQPELGPLSERAGPRGTMEMGLADDNAGAALSRTDGHGVEATTLGAHTHDHTHRKQASPKFAAHDHHHLHFDDTDADGRLNGHTHARAHVRLPWERADSG